MEVIKSDYVINQINYNYNKVYNEYIGYINEQIKDYRFSIYHKSILEVCVDRLKIHYKCVANIANTKVFLDKVVVALKVAGWEVETTAGCGSLYVGYIRLQGDSLG